MAINKRLIAGAPTGGGGACTTDTLQILGDSSCIAYYKMADATDESGSYSGTATSVDFNAEGKYGIAGKFNGSSSVINLGDHNVFSPSVNALSVSCWIKTTGTVDFIFSKGGSGAYEYGLLVNSSGQIELQAYTLSASSSVSINTSSAYNDGNWHHIVGVYDPSGNFKIYVDGLQQATSSSSLSMGNSSNALIFGKKYDTSSDFYDGSLDQIRIFNKAVSALEVSTLSNEVQCATAVTPSQHFDTVIYTGDGGVQSISTLNFPPDLVWIKKRNSASSSDHLMQDTVRGIGSGGGAKIIYPNDTTQEVGNADTDYFRSFDSDGFTLGGNTYYNGNFNYVAWSWKAAASTSTIASGTNGSNVISNVRVNTESGFSIVKFTALAAANSIVSHGLSSAPELIIYKNLDSADNWYVYHSRLSSPNTQWINLNLNSTATTNGTNNFSAVTSSTFTVNLTNNADDTICYCFAEKEGFSRFGSYLGNGTSQSIVTGFEVGFVIIKSSTSAQNWMLYDNKRSGKNYLIADTNGQEGSSTSDLVTFHTNGFSVGSSNSENQSGQTFIFMAFAQDPDTSAPTLADSFSAITYTGTGSAQSTNSLSSQSGSVSFKSDLVWIKARNFASSNALFDSIRGTANFLSSNTQTKALTISDDATLANTLTSFDSNGFSLGTDNGAYGVNASAKTYVAWNFKAADHDRNLATINQDGSTSSLVSANPAGGFSIVKYVGNSAANQTVGHGLGAIPKLILFKKLDGTSDWPVYSSALTDASYRILLNSADAQDQDNNPFNSTAPTSSVFTVKSDAGNVNTNGESHIAYCFAETDNQKFGTYAGNSSTPPSITTGFSPSFVVIKELNGSNPWVVIDSVRAPSNPASARLRLNATDVEYIAATEAINRSGTGFTVNSNWDGMNGNSKTYLYWAIA